VQAENADELAEVLRFAEEHYADVAMTPQNPLDARAIPLPLRLDVSYNHADDTTTTTRASAPSTSCDGSPGNSAHRQPAATGSSLNPGREMGSPGLLETGASLVGMHHLIPTSARCS
jgi:hypothetical protein